MIKRKPPYPFQTIALAVSFSPGLKYLVAEMRRLCDLHKSVAVFIHVGKKTGDKQREFSFLLSENGFHDGNSRIYWENDDVTNCILRICKHEVVDLLVCGASERENFNMPAGSTAWDLATRAKCSVLIYSGQPPGLFNKIVVNGIEHNKTDLTLLTALYFAEKEKSPALFVVEENDGNNYSGDRPLVSNDSMTVREAIEKSNIILNQFTLSGENCATLSEFAFKNNADLLVTYSSDHKLLIFDRIANKNGIEALLKDLSCNLLVVHSRLPEQ